MQKNNIRMVVQSQCETAHEFAERLESICYDLSVKHKDKLHMPPIVFLTSASDGRQTATLQFVTTETDKTKQETFNGFHLRIAYDRFKELTNKENKETDSLLDFLLSEVIDDYVSN
jgi:hypothetical protein